MVPSNIRTRFLDFQITLHNLNKWNTIYTFTKKSIKKCLQKINKSNCFWPLFLFQKGPWDEESDKLFIAQSICCLWSTRVDLPQHATYHGPTVLTSQEKTCTIHEMHHHYLLMETTLPLLCLEKRPQALQRGIRITFRSWKPEIFGGCYTHSGKQKQHSNKSSQAVKLQSAGFYVAEEFILHIQKKMTYEETNKVSLQEARHVLESQFQLHLPLNTFQVLSFSQLKQNLSRIWNGWHWQMQSKRSKHLLI